MHAKTTPRILTALGALAFVYFVLYPEDVKAVLAPIASVIELSQTVSPWLYLVIAVGIVAWAVVRVWGRRAPDR
jgi:hypothetical protein